MNFVPLESLHGTTEFVSHDDIPEKLAAACMLLSALIHVKDERDPSLLDLDTVNDLAFYREEGGAIEVAIRDDLESTVVGIISTSVRTDDDCTYTWVDLLAVDQQKKIPGTGRALLNRAETLARVRSHDYVGMLAYEESQGFYTHLGYGNNPTMTSYTESRYMRKTVT